MEYGKFCVRKDGPIETGEDHQILGYSPGFPFDAVWKSKLYLAHGGLGVTHHESDGYSLLTGKHLHGTVIRPFQYEKGKFGIIGYRIGIRSENHPEEGRYYTLARYVFDKSGTCSPAEIYHALGKLEGITRKQTIDPVVVPIQNNLSPDLPVKGSTGVLLAAVTAGQPLRIANEQGDLSEANFFNQVDAVWKRLPKEL